MSTAQPWRSPLPAAATATAPELYPALVGPGWAALPAAVRAIHSLTRTAPARGTVTVRRGASLLARLLGVLLRLPTAGSAVAAELRVTAHGRGQRWSRRFDGVPLVTDQGAHDGALLEFVGPFSLAFHLRAEPDALVFAQQPTRIGRPGFLLPWPTALSPRIDGRCVATGADTARVHVVIQAPFVGLLVSYEGGFRVASGAA